MACVVGGGALSGLYLVLAREMPAAASSKLMLMLSISAWSDGAPVDGIIDPQKGRREEAVLDDDAWACERESGVCQQCASLQTGGGNSAEREGEVGQ